jgi:1,4-dihydroxy-2-naphthoate octaprenyltransferase
MTNMSYNPNQTALIFTKNRPLEKHLTSIVLQRSTIQLLRFHFSFFLLPIFLFAISQVDKVNWTNATIAFFVLHVLVYPSSNGYNSYMDRDQTSIGGLKNPLQPTRQLFHLTIAMDVSAILISLCISVYFASGVLLYILASRAYSYRGIRLKRFALTGYLIVVLCQGGLSFWISYHAVSADKRLDIPVLPILAAMLLIGGYYPLTQVYQHQEDKKDGVNTISMLLGKRGSFVFCGGIFALATLLMFLTFQKQNQLGSFFIFSACMLPMMAFFLQWMVKVWKNEAAANFRNSLWMNVLASACTTICFLTLIILKGIE